MKSKKEWPPERRREWIARGILAFIVLAVGLLTLPALPYAGDPYAWREEARSIMLHGTLHVPPEIAQTFGSPGQYYVLNKTNNLWYSKYGIASGILNAIPLSVEKMITGKLSYGDSPTRILILGIFFVLMALCIAALLFEITGFYTTDLFVRVFFVLIALYTTYEWNYLRSTSAESTLLLFFLLFYYFFLQFSRRNEVIEKRPLLEIYAAWAAIGILAETRFYFLFLGGILAAFILYKIRNDISKQKEFIVKAIILPGLVVIGILGIVNWVKFGGPLSSGYGAWTDPTKPNSFADKIYDFVFSPQWSLIACFPPLVLAFFGMKKFFLKHREESIVIVAVFVVPLCIIITQNYYRGEAAYGMRYFTFILPLLALPAIYPLEQMKKGTLVLTLCIAGLLVFAQMQVNRLDFQFRYWVEGDIRSAGIKSPEVYDYFDNTHYAQINWDHLVVQGDWQKLPYFKYIETELSPVVLVALEQKIQTQTFKSNLYWFPKANQ